MLSIKNVVIEPMTAKETSKYKRPKVHLVNEKEEDNKHVKIDEQQELSCLPKN